MGISKKGKRTIIYKEKEYVWWVREEEEYCAAPWLTIASPDKSLILSYRIEGGDFFVISKGRMFQGRETTGKWEYYWYPFEKRTPPLVITPGFVRELIAWAVDGRGAVMISGKKLVTGSLYRLVLCDEELSYDNFKEEFCIGIFSSQEKAEAVAKHYLRNVEGFKDYHCSYRIVKKKVFGGGTCGEENDKKNRGKVECGTGSDVGIRESACTDSDDVYMVYGWDENSEGDEVNIVESDCFMEELAAKKEMVMMKQTYVRSEWGISKFRVNEWHWKEGFVRV
ncbi:MAG: hypothetical protein K2N63_02115 [Lachnospiraceae bacterium]|nr:hypothetical protein [Lachnospiraceae bacterium]